MLLFMRKTLRITLRSIIRGVLIPLIIQFRDYS
nr:MAG TPA: hypothetical protein [Caudoviricetes sp.]